MTTPMAPVALAAGMLLGACAGPAPEATGPAVPRPTENGEAHLTNLRQLTFGGENAEAYFSFAGDRLIFQSTRDGAGCDQIYSMKLDGSDVRLLSTGQGRTTCAYFYPDDTRFLYASTHLAGPGCPPAPDMSQGYVWALYPAYDIFVASLTDLAPRRLTDSPGYDAEATISPTGDRIVFTSVRDGDLDLYSMNLDGTDVRRLTDSPGYDGGAFFSPDGSKIVWRASRPTGSDLVEYRRLLGQGLIRPSRLEIFVANADGSDARRITDNGAANFAPFFHPSGEKVVFASNMDDPTGRDFDLYLIGVDGSGLERVTRFPGFDGFPMWAPDGRTFVFCSNRHNDTPGETNVFLADWVD